MAAFPSSLPKPLMAGYEFGSIDPWVEDAPEVGSNRRRARFTRALQSFSFTLRLTDAERAVLKAFYDTTLANGVDSFTWTAPHDDTAYVVRFTAAPSYASVTYNVWDVSMTFIEV